MYISLNAQSEHYFRHRVIFGKIQQYADEGQLKSSD